MRLWVFVPLLFPLFSTSIPASIDNLNKVDYWTPSQVLTVANMDSAIAKGTWFRRRGVFLANIFSGLLNIIPLFVTIVSSWLLCGRK